MIGAAARLAAFRRHPGRTAPLGLLLLVALSACGDHPAERFIQGTWSSSGVMPGTLPRHAVAWYSEWTFESGRFQQSGYPPVQAEGRYRIVRATDRSITLTLFQQKGDFSESDRTIEIDIDKAAGTISVNKGPALRRKTGQ